MRQTYEELKEDVERALKRIVKGTSREMIDIFQLAFLDTPQKMEIILSKNGGRRALEEAREEGMIDYILGAAHNPRSMLQVINSGRFDVIEFPFNIIEDEYIRKVIPLAREKDIGTVVMKPLGGGQLGSVAENSLRWILSHDVTCAIPGMRNTEEVKKNVRVGHVLQPLAAQEYGELKEKGEQIGKEYCHSVRLTSNGRASAGPATSTPSKPKSKPCSSAIPIPRSSSSSNYSSKATPAATASSKTSCARSGPCASPRI